ncbi:MULTISPECIES: mannose-1-phosphate guanylyltransferase [Micromonospora]|uniref:mannose-1-phosphate guanylyltransferase n=1 Tax=Micromonospora maris TaxID=1003110 RepID=A0A9X0I7D6_9ACTN|nr:sugar phosphate nucleotidyltransferase [Micromonospora maris]AEB43007.1 mannose-1-phosphate guanylyltransferase [Micromonospora maris AB-18-032]KUJ48389.1 mannose-1-phosphate guanylyltransferase [Micromonospora maris]
MIYVVIPAGGSGTRLWPLSRAGHPKFLHPFTGTSASLLQATVQRAAPLTTPERTMVVTGAAHAAAVARQLTGLPEENILVEPSPRDSCAAIALAAAVIAVRDPDAVMGSFAADHLIGDPQSWVETVQAAIRGAEQGLLMTVGITPTRPETGYGYLQTGDPVGDGPMRPVTEFKEKPNAEVAEAYVRSGRYLWNAGMFVWRVSAFLAELARQQPALHAGVTSIAAAWGSDEQDDVLGAVWPTLPKISVDYAVMEGAASAGRVATVPGDFRWNDVGDFHTLGEVLPADADGNVVLGMDDKAEVLLRDSSGMVVVPQSGRLVATVGVRDLIVVDTSDALLVCPRDRAQDVKAIVDELKERGEDKLV